MTTWASVIQDPRVFEISLFAFVGLGLEVIGTAAIVGEALFPPNARAAVPKPYSWALTPPTNNQSDYIKWMVENRGEDPKILALRAGSPTDEGDQEQTEYHEEQAYQQLCGGREHAGEDDPDVEGCGHQCDEGNPHPERAQPSPHRVPPPFCRSEPSAKCCALRCANCTEPRPHRST